MFGFLLDSLLIPIPKTPRGCVCFSLALRSGRRGA